MYNLEVIHILCHQNIANYLLYFYMKNFRLLILSTVSDTFIGILDIISVGIQ